MTVWVRFPLVVQNKLSYIRRISTVERDLGFMGVITRLSNHDPRYNVMDPALPVRTLSNQVNSKLCSVKSKTTVSVEGKFLFLKQSGGGMERRS